LRDHLWRGGVVGAQVLGVVVGHGLGLQVTRLDLESERVSIAQSRGHLRYKEGRDTHWLAVNHTWDLERQLGLHLLDGGLEAFPLGTANGIVALYHHQHSVPISY
jgi:hypothetical protein